MFNINTLTNELVLNLNKDKQYLVIAFKYSLVIMDFMKGQISALLHYRNKVMGSCM